MIAAEAPLLAVEDLCTHFFTQTGVVKSVDGVSFALRRGETLALVGESGSGKSVTSLSILRLLASPGRIVSGQIRFTSRDDQTRDLTQLPERDMRRIRGNEIAMIFQEPMTSLNPVYTVGEQIAESVMLHRRKGRRESLEVAAGMLDLVGVSAARRRLHDYPHQMSGGMRQRVMIALALCCNPVLLIADEPTTALDVTVQAQILDLLRKLRAEFHVGILFITHNLAVVAEIADRVAVMYRGRVVEEGTCGEIFRAPKHVYTQALFESLPRMGAPRVQFRAIPGEPLLQVRNLTKHFPGRNGSRVHALNDVSFTLQAGEVLGLVGESGSGKSTLGRSVLRLLTPDAGQIFSEGTDITSLSARQLIPFRRRMQMVFQDPYASLDPRMTAGQIISEALEIHDVVLPTERPARVKDLLQTVGLSPEYIHRYPHEFSGGQRQRLSIARALAVQPALLVADESVSALDVSVQAQILDLLRDLQQKLQLSVLFISHDLAIVEQLCQRVMVMYLGRIMESAPTSSLYGTPKHPYTEALLAAAPVPVPGVERHRTLLKGDLPSALDPPSGCVFRTRCPYAIPDCSQAVPALIEIAPGHFKACIRNVL